MQPKFNSKDIEIILGLGNPGREYENTYHNVGFLMIDYLRRGNQPIKKQKYEVYKLGEFSLIKPTFYMMNNSSGTATVVMKDFHIQDPRKILFAHDDSDLMLGDYKFYFDGGSAGHKGIESIIKLLGTEDFWRLRIGIRPPEEKSRRKAEEFVLKKIKPADRKILEETFAKIIPLLH